MQDYEKSDQKSDRRDDQECVWRWNESLESWQTGCHRMTMDVDDMWVGCPWCRNRIRIEVKS